MMKSSLRLVFTLILSILLLAHNALGSLMLKKRIANANSDTTNYFKHEVRLTYALNGGILCTGSIISTIHVLTAAHCVIQPGSNLATGQLIEISAGITQVNNEQEFQTVRLVEEIYTPSYFVMPPVGVDSWATTVGDIAVLKLNFPLGVEFNPNLEALKLPYGEYETIWNTAGNQLYFTGFGGTKTLYIPGKLQVVTGVFPNYLQYSLAATAPSVICPALGNNQLKMCAVLLNLNAGTCNGDSGGSLFNENKIIFGILSYAPGLSCGYSTSPSYYTRVYPYLSFIYKAMNDVSGDKTILRQSMKGNAAYEKQLSENKQRYQRIFLGYSVKVEQEPINNTTAVVLNLIGK